MTQPRQQSDEALARLAADGDRAAFSELVQRYTRPLAEFAASRLPTVQDAEDVVQETFLRAYRGLGSFDSSYPLKNWLFTIAYRLVISHYRKKRPGPLDDSAAAAIPDTSAEPPPRHGWLWRQVRQMKPGDHDVLWLRYKQDMSMGDIAAVLGTSEAGVRVQLHRARKRLARKITDTPDCRAVVRDSIVCLERTR